MYVAATSVSQAVREVLASISTYQEILESRIANFTAMAERIKPEVENKEVSSEYEYYLGCAEETSQ